MKIFYLNLILFFSYMCLGCPHSKIVKEPDWRLDVSKFEFWSSYYAHFWTNTFGRGIKTFLPFHKKGDLGLAKNYRGMTLTSIAAKIYNALLRNCIEPKIDNILRKNQNGFQRNRSSTSQILTIRRILEGVQEKTYKRH